MFPQFWRWIVHLLYFLFLHMSGIWYSVYIWFKSATHSVCSILFCGQTCQVLFTIYRTAGAPSTVLTSTICIFCETLLHPPYLIVCLSNSLADEDPWAWKACEYTTNYLTSDILLLAVKRTNWPLPHLRKVLTLFFNLINMAWWGVFVIFTLSLGNNRELGDRGRQWRTWADVLFPSASDCRAVGSYTLPILIRWADTGITRLVTIMRIGFSLCGKLLLFQ